MKTCKRCGDEKPLEDFYVNRAMKDGRMSLCKACSSAKSKKYHQDNLEKQRELAREKQRDRWKSDPEGTRRKQWEYRLKSKYGITVDDYDRMLNEQDGKCAICKSVSPGWPSVRAGAFHVDHDHRTGKVRGLLCNTCNQGLGYFKDDPALLWAAATYIAGVSAELLSVEPEGR